jgi:hypothetical protein
MFRLTALSPHVSFSLTLLAVCGGLAPVRAQPLPGSARALGLADAVTALSGDPNVVANPAAPAALSARHTLLFAGEAYGLPELRVAAVSHSESVGFGALSVGALAYGYDAYQEVQAYAGLAAALPGSNGRGVSLGITVGYTKLSIPGYGSAGAIIVTLGGLIPLGPTVEIGFTAHNVNDGRPAGREALPRHLSLGLGYRPGARSLLLVDVRKDVLFPPVWRGGFEYAPVDVLVMRFGVSRPPSRFSLGMGVRPGPFELDLAAVHHMPLGWSLAGSLNVTW